MIIFYRLINQSGNFLIYSTLKGVFGYSFNNGGTVAESTRNGVIKRTESKTYEFPFYGSPLRMPVNASANNFA
jgi:hypothetical protein